MRFLACLALLLLAAFPVFAGQHYEGQKEVHFAYSYGSRETIPGTDGVIPATCHKPSVRFGPEETQNGTVGLSYAYFLRNDLSVEGGGFMSLGKPGGENLGLSGGVDYFLGNFFLPAGIGYRGDLDSLTVDLGVGYEYLFKNKALMRVKAGPQYLAGHGINENWAWKAEAGLGWAF